MSQKNWSSTYYLNILFFHFLIDIYDGLYFCQFAFMDRDANGSVSLTELKEIAKTFGLKTSQKMIQHNLNWMKEFDDDGNNEIVWKEYRSKMMNDDPRSPLDDPLDAAFGKAYENFIKNCIDKIQSCATELDGKPVITLNDFKSFITSPSYDLRK